MADSARTTAPTSGRGAKRSRENETPSQRHKREKAAERQRRKRERDRQAASAAAAGTAVAAAAAAAAALGHPPPPQTPGVAAGPPPTGLMSYPPPPPMLAAVEGHFTPGGPPPTGAPLPKTAREYIPPAPTAPAPIPVPVIAQPPLPPPQPGPGEEGMSPEELMRREKVRAAARERQRKHRALVKQRKMRELGLDMGNEQLASSGMEYTYHPPSGSGVPIHEDGPHGPNGGPSSMGGTPPGQATPATGGGEQPGQDPIPMIVTAFGGQTFASTLLLSFSCAPVLKSHLLRTLHMTNEELASLEPVIAAAWDQWNHERRMYATQASSSKAEPAPVPYQANNPASNEFRARFRHSIAVPVPFQQPESASTSAQQIDPTLRTAEEDELNSSSVEDQEGEEDDA